jgi:hypothetical protein
VTTPAPLAVRTRALGLAGPVMLIVGIVGVVVALSMTNRASQVDLAVTGNPAIEGLIPERNAEVLRQTEIGIDLAPGYEAELVIDGVPIPVDEMNILRDVENPNASSSARGSFGTTLNRFTFQPLEGRAIEELLGDRHCVIAYFWPLSDRDARQAERWCFYAS